MACYGVEVPGAEGRAGMIAIVQQDDIDMDELSRELATTTITNLCCSSVCACCGETGSSIQDYQATFEGRVI